MTENLDNIKKFDVKQLTKEQQAIIDRELTIPKTLLIAAITRLIRILMEVEQGDKSNVRKHIEAGIIQQDILNVLLYTIAQEHGIEDMEISFAEKVYKMDDNLRQIIIDNRHEDIREIGKKYQKATLDNIFTNILERAKDGGTDGVKKLVEDLLAKKGLEAPKNMEESVRLDMKLTGKGRTEVRAEFMKDNPFEKCDKCDSIDCFLNFARDEELKELG